MSYKLTYFQIKGRAETIRMLFALGKQKYEDNRVHHSKWSDLRPTLPYGSLPVLEVDGKRYCQTLAIERFLARRFGLYGKDEFDQIQADMVRECVLEISQEASKIKWTTDTTQAAELTKKFIEEKIPEWLTNLEKMLSKQGYFVGQTISWPDLAFFTCICMCEDIGLKLGEKLKKTPKLQALIEKVEKQPQIKAWIETRPKSEY